MQSQLVYTLATLLIVPFMFEVHWLHVATLLGFLLSTLWNGASYYIEVFSQRYALQFDKPHAGAMSAMPAATACGATKLR